MRVLLIEDHPIVRAGSRRMLQSMPETEVREASTGTDGVRACAEWDPDIVVLDLHLPDGSGFAFLRQMLDANPNRRILVFSMYEDAGFVARALQAGAVGYVTKSDDPNELVTAVQAVRDGAVHLGAVAARKLALMNLRPADGKLDQLSPRELEVMELLGDGHSLAEIAARLGVSYRSSAHVVAQLRGKLGVSSTAALIKLALERLPRERAP